MALTLEALRASVLNALVLSYWMNFVTKEECEIAASNLGKTYIGAACLKREEEQRKHPSEIRGGQPCRDGPQRTEKEIWTLSEA